MPDNDNGEALPALEGYVRSNALHQSHIFRVDVLSLDPPVAVLDLETGDGLVSLAMNRDVAERLMHQLHLFLTTTVGRA